jgi:anti-sigma B factor antagonist
MGYLEVSDEAIGGDVRILSLTGDVDFDAAPQLKRHIMSRVDAGDRQLIVDLSEVEFIDSTAIGVLVGALRRLGANGGSLTVVCNNEDIRGIFETVGLAHVFPLHRSHEDALAALAHAA